MNKCGIEMNKAYICKMMNELVSDKDFNYLIKSKDKENFFDTIGRSFKEEYHSSFIAWLLNPSSSHGLGGFALQRLFALYNDKYEALDNKQLQGGPQKM